MLDTAFDIRIRVAESAQSGEGASSIAKDRIDRDDPKQTLLCREIAFTWQIMTYHISWYILIYNDISWHFVIKIKKHDFFAKAHNNDIFVAKIYDYVLFDSFWRSAGLIDSPTSYAALIRITKYDMLFVVEQILHHLCDVLLLGPDSSADTRGFFSLGSSFFEATSSPPLFLASQWFALSHHEGWN